MKWILVCLAAGAVYALLDLARLRFGAAAYYRDAVGDVLAKQFRIAPGIAFYIVYMLALVWYAVLPGVGLGMPINLFGFQPRSIPYDVANAILSGAMIGIVVNALIAFSNQGRLREWPWMLTLLDICWGGAASALAAGVAAKLFGLIA